MSAKFDRHDFTPLAWPVKAAVLFLLGLPPDADRATYEQAWEKAVYPAKKKAMDAASNVDPKP